MKNCTSSLIDVLWSLMSSLIDYCGQETVCVVVVNKDEECDKVLLYWSPEMCASESGVDEPLAPMMSASTHVSHTHYFHFQFLYNQPAIQKLHQVRPGPPKTELLGIVRVVLSTGQVSTNRNKH